MVLKQNICFVFIEYFKIFLSQNASVSANYSFFMAFYSKVLTKNYYI
ncbi:hypothetical protein HMPREF1350_02911 [Enterococcus faecium 509]|nr:hypothetical protein HMPREF1350_02911 [Enterococcus faecium 509]